MKPLVALAGSDARGLPACTGDGDGDTARQIRAVAGAVEVRSRPEGVTLADPAFTALRGAKADFGRLGGAVYEVEMPARWNGRLVLFMHGFEELGPGRTSPRPTSAGT